MKRFLEWFGSPQDIDPVLEAAVAHFIVKNPGGGRSTSYRLADPDEGPV